MCERVSVVPATPPTIGVDAPGVFVEEDVSGRTLGTLPADIISPRSQIDDQLHVGVVLVKLDGLA